MERYTSSTLKEITVLDYILKPERHLDFTVVPAFAVKNQDTVMKVSYTLKHPLVNGDELWVEFVINNGKY